MQRNRGFVVLFRFGTAIVITSLLVLGCGPGGGSSSVGVPGGSDTVFVLNSIKYGRLVDLFDFNGKLVKQNVVVEPDIQNDADYSFDINSLTDQPTLTILFAEGSSQFDTARAALDDNLPPLVIKGPIGFGGGPATPPFPVIPRNSALKLNFNNPVDPTTVDLSSIRIFVGSPPLVAFTVRYLIDPDDARHLILDSTVSQYEADKEGGNANLTGFPQGFSENVHNLKLEIPTSFTANSDQFTLLRDTKGNLLQPTASDPVEGGSILRIFRSALSSDTVGQFLSDPTIPQLLGVQRVSFVSAASSPVSGKWRITYKFDLGGDNDRLDGGVCFLEPGVGDIFVQGSGFGIIKAAGDEDPDSGNPNPTVPIRTSVFTVDLTLLDGTIGTGLGSTRHIYVDAKDADRKPCFIDYSIDPSTIDLGTKIVGVDPLTKFILHFTKPLDPFTVRANDTVVLGNANNNPLSASNKADLGGDDTYFGLNTGPQDPAASSLVPVQIFPFGDRKSFSINPLNPLKNDSLNVDGDCGTPGDNLATNCHYFHLVLGTSGPKDLGGNPLPLAPGTPGNGGSADFKVAQIYPLDAATAGATYTSDGIAIRFNTIDLVEDGATSNQIMGGQYSTATAGEVAGRPVQRFSRVADRFISPNGRLALDRATLGGLLRNSLVDPPFPAPPNSIFPAQAPLVPFGCRMMTVWRYFDLGLSLGELNGDQRLDGNDDFGQYNLDVEGLNWSPHNGLAVVDRFNLISIALAHSHFSPDEHTYLDTIAGAITDVMCYEDSGLVIAGFNDNRLKAATVETVDSSLLEPTTVYNGPYVINPANTFKNPPEEGTILVPFPDFPTTYTWRDTRLVITSTTASRKPGDPILGGPKANGMDPDVFCKLGLFTNFEGQAEACNPQLTTINCQDQTIGDWTGYFVAGNPDPDGDPDTDDAIPDSVQAFSSPTIGQKITNWWPPTTTPSDSSIPSIGLPLLVEYKVFTDLTALGGNRFQTLQINPTFNNTVTGTIPLRPAFRILSGGGSNSDGSLVFINPEGETVPRGQVIPGSLNLLTELSDDVVYVGQVDFVTKTSVAFSRWFPTGLLSPVYTGAIVEPTAEELAPLGISVEIAFRGSNDDPLSAAGKDAKTMDPYGNTTGITPSTGWVTDITQLMNSKNFQLRVTFSGNSNVLIAPHLTSIQVGWK